MSSPWDPAEGIKSLGGQSHVPIYERIKRRIKGDIARGRLKPGERVPSELQLAKALGVSRGQTRQALRDLELEGLVLRRPGSGTFVASSTHRIRQKGVHEVRTVICAYPLEARTYYVQMITKGFFDSAVRAGFHTVFYYLDRNWESESRFLANLDVADSEGLAVWPIIEGDKQAALLRKYQELSYPVVVFDQKIPGIECDFTGTDNESAIRQLTARLIDRGHHTIAFVAAAIIGPVQVARFHGYQAALADAGIPFRDELARGCGTRWDASEQTARHFVHLTDRPTAFVCGDDVTASILLDHLETLSVYAPDDVEVAALVDAAPRERDERLTMIAVQKGYEIGRTAFEVLHRRIQDPARPVHVQLIPAEILITGSGTGRRELRVPVDPVSIPNPQT